MFEEARFDSVVEFAAMGALFVVSSASSSAVRRIRVSSTLIGVTFCVIRPRIVGICSG